MTTVAISGLPVATVINAADIVPFVQSGTTKSISKTLLFTSPTIATPTMTGPILGTVTSGNISACTSTSMVLTTPVLGTVTSGNISACTSTSMVMVTPVLGAATATSLTAAGNILINNSSGKAGYTTGAGSTVVQSASRISPSGDVLISRPTGSITLFSAAGSTTAVSFIVNNYIVTATDVIILNQKSGTDKYDLMVTSVAANQFEITLRTTGGTTTETPVISFAVISGAVS